MGSCKNLTDLTVGTFHGKLSDLSVVLANRQLKRLSIDSCSDVHSDNSDANNEVHHRLLGRIGENIFGDIVGAHPWLDFLSIPAQCSFERPTAKLRLTICSLCLDGLLPILTQHCHPLRKLELHLEARGDIGGLLTTISEHIGARLLSYKYRRLTSFAGHLRPNSCGAFL